MLDRRELLLSSLAAGTAAWLLPAVTWAAEIGVAPGLNGAGARIYQELAAKEKDNVFLSPLSIGLAFAMLSTAATGETLAELERAFGFPEAKKLPDACKALGDRLVAEKAITVGIANRLWGAPGLTPTAAFLAAAKRGFGAGLETIDFAQNVAAAKAINAWVASKTADKITDLVPASVLGPMTRLVLTNAVYFKGTWEKQFLREATRPARFRRTDGSQVEAPLMHANRPAQVADEADAQILRLPYKGGYAMYVVLPRAVDGLPALERRADGATPASISTSTRRRASASMPTSSSPRTSIAASAASWATPR
jgi:serpin B